MEDEFFGGEYEIQEEQGFLAKIKNIFLGDRDDEEGWGILSEEPGSS